MKILFLSDNFFPEVNAPANRTYEHCREWVKNGAEVTVITCVPNFPRGIIFEGYKNRIYQTEWIEGIRVVRVWSYISSNSGTFRRVLDYVSYSVMAFFVSLFYKTDVIIATSPQFFTAITGAFSSMVKRKPWIMEVRDIWPESILAVGAIKNRWIISLLERTERWLYRRARKIVVVTDSFKNDLTAKGIDADKIEVIKNGVYLCEYKPIPKNVSLLKELNLEYKFIVAYMGTHGMAHKLDFIIKAAGKVIDSDIHFLLIGDGAERVNLAEQKQEQKADNVTMLSSVAKADIQKYISIIDVALVNLKKSDTFKKVIPSKIFENASMEKPILLGVEGEARAIIEKYCAGMCFEPENDKDFLLKLSQIKMAAKSGKFLEGSRSLSRDFDREKLAKRMLIVVESSIWH